MCIEEERCKILQIDSRLEEILEHVPNTVGECLLHTIDARFLHSHRSNSMNLFSCYECTLVYYVKFPL